MKAAVALLCVAAAAFAYEGKYEDDPRLARIRKELPARYAKARDKVAAALSYKVPAFPLVLEDAGKDRSGVMAETRKGPVIVLKTEYLVLDAHDLNKTLAHELVHCMQRKLGGHGRLPTWAREGMALHVAGQTAERAQLLAVIALANPVGTDSLGRLVDGLDGPHDLYDYAEDGIAFEILGERAGEAMPALLLRLCREGVSALPLPVAQLDRLTRKRARARLPKLLATAGAQRGVLELAESRVREGNLDHAREFWTATALRPPRRALLGRQQMLALQLAPDDRFAAAAALARKDLEPFVEYEQVLALIARRGGRAAPSPFREAR